MYAYVFPIILNVVYPQNYINVEYIYIYIYTFLFTTVGTFLFAVSGFLSFFMHIVWIHTVIFRHHIR